ncbi:MULTISPECIES: putative colanic acid biosynthesis acetyltransferase [Alphaproteobacteria]|uniref:putative colanic acid biosynthesis acetyltransferase n=1 Tax=Alphaproteobacteria TaxID=28211 RepID=UPI0024E0A7A9|nr:MULTISPECIES: putative colanic acid biosynthesis acetyltransferase [Alphaproteobacteria]
MLNGAIGRKSPGRSIVLLAKFHQHALTRVEECIAGTRNPLENEATGQSARSPKAGEDGRVQSVDTEVFMNADDAPIFGLRHRLTRMAWGITWMLLASWTQPFHGWRRFLLRVFGAKVGRGVYVAPSARIWYPGTLTLKDFCAIADHADIYSMGEIVIGRHAVISKRAHICTGTHDINDTRFQLTTAPIHIGDYAWIAADAFVGPGVTVGEGAVLGTHAVTVKDLAPWTVYIGNPCREIKKRKSFERHDEPVRGWRESRRPAGG